jgi:hypothetical protein
MKRLLITLCILLVTATALAQNKTETKEPDYNTVREFRNKVFEVRNRSPRDLYSSISLLGSGFKGAAINMNEEMQTITVRDFPENIAAIEDALKRLDRAADARPDMELRISVLIGSKTPLASGGAVPDELVPVIKQLQATLRYSHYGLMTTTVHRTTAGRMIEGSGVADAALLGLTASQERPIIYRYTLRNLRNTAAQDRRSIDIETFEFSMNVPIVLTAGAIQYQPLGFQTPVSIRENEKVVIGTTSMGDKALIVVMSATFVNKGAAE